MKPIDVTAAALLIIGGINWGLVALAEFDLVAWIFGEEFGATTAASRSSTDSSASPPSTPSPCSSRGGS